MHQYLSWVSQPFLQTLLLHASSISPLWVSPCVLEGNSFSPSSLDLPKSRGFRTSLNVWVRCHLFGSLPQSHTLLCSCASLVVATGVWVTRNYILSSLRSRSDGDITQRSWNEKSQNGRLHSAQGTGLVVRTACSTCHGSLSLRVSSGFYFTPL